MIFQDNIKWRRCKVIPIFRWMFVSLSGFLLVLRACFLCTILKLAAF